MVFAVGKRTKVYKFFSFIVKVKKSDSEAIGRVRNEGIWLKRLNEYGIGPKLYYFNDKFLVYRFVKGLEILDFFKKAILEEKKEVMMEVLRQCRVLDKMKVDKFEMHHPMKHILVSDKVVMIDFERCKYGEKPKNVTQFCQFMNRCYKKVNDFELKKILKKYKKSYSDESFNEIVGLFS
ncbi:MAG: hypothetical protein AABW46_02305 [Nanoarchaeota archaeon]